MSIAEMSAEIYDPDSGAWSAAGSLNLGRAWHRATLLLDGRVLVTGGTSGGFLGSETAELYEPATDVWSPAGKMNSRRDYHTATLLLSGKVLVAGGLDPGPPPYDGIKIDTQPCEAPNFTTRPTEAGRQRAS